MRHLARRAAPRQPAANQCRPNLAPHRAEVSTALLAFLFMSAGAVVLLRLARYAALLALFIAGPPDHL